MNICLYFNSWANLISNNPPECDIDKKLCSFKWRMTLYRECEIYQEEKRRMSDLADEI